MNQTRTILLGALAFALYSLGATASGAILYTESGFREMESNELVRVKQLLAGGADINAKDQCGFQKRDCDMTLLQKAAWLGFIQVTDFLLSKGADIEAKDNTVGWTPLHIAAVHHHKEVVRLLLSKGADTNAKDHSGETPLALVAKFGSLDDCETVELLLAHGADINTKNSAGETPLRSALKLGHTEMANFLRQHGAKE